MAAFFYSCTITVNGTFLNILCIVSNTLPLTHYNVWEMKPGWNLNYTPVWLNHVL